MAESKLEAIFDKVDGDNSGTIEYGKFKEVQLLKDRKIVYYKKGKSSVFCTISLSNVAFIAGLARIGRSGSGTQSERYTTSVRTDGESSQQAISPQSRGRGGSPDGGNISGLALEKSRVLHGTWKKYLPPQ